jgi:hypothetical protein
VRAVLGAIAIGLQEYLAVDFVEEVNEGFFDGAVAGVETAVTVAGAYEPYVFAFLYAEFAQHGIPGTEAFNELGACLPNVPDVRILGCLLVYSRSLALRV